MFKRWILILALFAPAMSARAEVFRLDFGDGPVRKGWEAVTADDERWRGAERAQSHCDIPDYVALMREKKVKQVYPTAISCDFVTGHESARLTLEAPDGDYTCWVLFGHADVRMNPQIPYYFDTHLAINGEVRDTVRLSAPAVFEDRSFFCQAKNGKISVEFATGGVQWIATAIMIYGQEDAAEAEKEIAAVMEEIAFLPRQLAGRWRLRERFVHEKAPQLTPEEIERGYVVFHRSALREVYPLSKPARDEIDAKVEAFATPGEFEPLTFSIYPLDELHIRSVTADLPGTTLTICRVVCQRIKEGGYNSAPEGRYRIEPSYLAPVDAWGVALEKEKSVRFWITAHVDEDAAPGRKEGSATLALANGTTIEVPLSLEVLPFVLKKSPDVTYSVYFDTRLWFFLGGNWKAYPRRSALARIVERHTRAYLADLRDHGMNALSAPVAWTVREGVPAATAVETSDRVFSLYSEYGLDKLAVYWRLDTGRMVKAIGGEILKEAWRYMPKDLEDPKFYDFLKGVVRAIEAEREKRGWPEIVYAPVDEPFGSKEQVIFAQKSNAAIREEGVRTYCTMKVWSTGSLGPMVDLRTYGPGFLRHGTPNYDLAHPEDTGAAENTRPGQEYWVYPNMLTAHSGTPAATGRFMYGFYGYKTGIQGYNPWHHANWRGNPFNEFDHSYSGGRFVLPGPDGPLPTPAYEGAREGIDDMRYVYTLERAIAEAGQTPAARKASALLDQIKGETPGYRDWVLRYAGRGVPSSKMIDDPELRKMWWKKTPAWPNEKMLEYRRRIADAIVALTSDVAE